MPNNLRFKFVVHHTVGSFEIEVNKALDEGWELHGAPFARDSYYCQSMTRTKTLDEILE